MFCFFAATGSSRTLSGSTTDISFPKSAAVKFRLRTLLAVITIVAVSLAAFSYWDAIPGTFHKTPNGFPRGTGSAEYRYDDGSLMLREWFYRGLPYQSTWFTPGGAEVATESFTKQTGGVGYYLRQDGTIRSKHTYEYDADEKMYFSIGVVYYDKSGQPAPEATEPID